MKVGEGVWGGGGGEVVSTHFIYLFNFLAAFALSSYFLFRLLIGHFSTTRIHFVFAFLFKFVNPSED